MNLKALLEKRNALMDEMDTLLKACGDGEEIQGTAGKNDGIPQPI